MSTSLFQVTEYTIPCQHIREYPRAVKSAQDTLKLAIKEYRPLNNLNASPDSITIIAAHANGIPKVGSLRASRGCAAEYQEKAHILILVLIEPIIQYAPPSGPNAAYLSSHRSDLWPSRSNAESSFRRNPFFKSWDSNAFDRYLQVVLRETPTTLYPEAAPGAVTLATTKHQEAWSYVRSNFTARSTEPHDAVEHLLAPDMDPANEGSFVFHRAECCIAWRGLPFVRPSILWLFGGKSPLNPPSSRDQKVTMAGTGIGGSGGVEAGMVTKAVIETAGHMLPMERVEETASTIARYLEKEVKRYREDEIFYKEFKSGKSERDMLVMSKQWLSAVRQKANTKRPIKVKL
ncbi:hypothetical protein MMC17_007027 [Xylographa soralifera]|nr:hypothetical protein [Xylographa soralifera]